MFSFLVLSCRSALFGQSMHAEQVETGVFLVTDSLMSINALAHSLEVSRFLARLHFLLVCLSLRSLLCLLPHTLSGNFCSLIEHFYTHSFRKLFGLCFLFIVNQTGSFERKIYKIITSLKSGAGSGMNQL